MDQKMYRICVLISAITMGTVFAFSITIGNFILPLIAIILGISLMYLCKRKVEGVIQDERTYKIAEKSSMRTIQILGPTTAILGVTTLTVSESGYIDLTEIGYALLYFNIALLGLYMFFYGYYSRKYKG